MSAPTLSAAIARAWIAHILRRLGVQQRMGFVEQQIAFYTGGSTSRTPGL